MISHLINSFLVGVLFADMLERRFPSEVRHFMTSITFNALYFYSKTQIYFTKLQISMLHFINSNPTLLKITNVLTSLVKSNVVVTHSEFFKNGVRLCLEDASQFDLAIYSWVDDDNKCVNRKTMYNASEQTTKVECSAIKFILMELSIGDNKSYRIDLKTDDYNFYLVGNKFTKQFFLYYLKQCLNIKEPIDDNSKFVLKIIDHDINSISIDFSDKNESITLDKHGYKISVINHSDE